MTKTVSSLLRAVSLIALAMLCTSALHADISVTLSPSPAGPQPVGTIITWTATVHDTEPGAHEYRFSVGPARWLAGDRSGLRPGQHDAVGLQQDGGHI